MKLTPLETILFDALTKAEQHLDFCGYGDAYERECAESSNLREKLEKALQQAEAKKKE